MDRDEHIDPDETELEYDLAGITSVEAVTRAYERDLLWCLLNGDPGMVGGVASIVEADDFRDPLHGRLFRGLLELHRRHRTVDAPALLELLTTKDHRNPVIPVVLDLWGSRPGGDPHPWRVEHYARRIHEKAVQRRLSAVTQAEDRALRGMAARLPDGTTIPAMSPARDVVAATAKARRELMREQETATALRPIGAFREEAMTPDTASALPTGLKALDQQLRGGIRPAELAILGGRPAMGKTAAALGMLATWSEKDIPGVLFSLEMTGRELYRRLLAWKAGIAQAEWRENDTDVWMALDKAADKIDEWGIALCDRAGVDLGLVRAECERRHAEGRLGWLMVDYLGLMKAGDADRHDLAIGVNTKGLKEIAKEFGIPVLLLAQLSRKVEERANKRPTQADLRDSGSIEQDADIILLLYRDSVYNPDTADPTEAEIIVAKQRNGPEGTVYVGWNGPLARFEESDPFQVKL